MDIMESVKSPALRVAWDNANFVQLGFSQSYALLRPYLEYFQVKDALASTGELDETIAALSADGFSGFASLEPDLAAAHELGGFSSPAAFRAAARAFAGAPDSAESAWPEPWALSSGGHRLTNSFLRRSREHANSGCYRLR